MPHPECPVCGQFHAPACVVEAAVVEAILGAVAADETAADLIRLERMWTLPAREPAH